MANAASEIWEKAEKTLKAKAEAEDEIVERAMAWSKAKTKDKLEIATIAVEAIEKAEAKARVRGNPTLFIGQRRRLTSRSDPD